jgi:importin subunit beta-1
MDVRQVLQSTLAPDAAERTNAEQQLAHAAEVDFVCSPCPSHTR